MKKLVAYYRVSADDLKLDINVQKDIVRKYCETCSAEIISEYKEYDSGKNNERTELSKALDCSLKNDAYFIVAKLERLTCDVQYGLQLCEKYNIIFCDYPDMGKFEQRICFSLIQKEREMIISNKTKSALMVLKKQGIKLGAPNATFTHEMRTKALEKRRKNTVTNDANKRAYEIVSSLTGNWEKKSRYLNSNGFLTAKGKAWTGYQVKLLVEAFESYYKT